MCLYHIHYCLSKNGSVINGSLGNCIDKDCVVVVVVAAIDDDVDVDVDDVILDSASGPSVTTGNFDLLFGFDFGFDVRFFDFDPPLSLHFVTDLDFDFNLKFNSPFFPL